ncbi:zinc-binding dehydrogenase [Streptosporangium canum]|uniref:zinc-binding dehydrogenase n=1 Tax=Streptosporangium canum TaxID=324952 RepID=UPI00368C133A
MKAAIMTAADQPLAYGDFPDPERREGWEIVELVAAALHPVARSRATGQHYSSSGEWPLVPGVDGVARTADGTLVYIGRTEDPYGTFAERIPVPAGLYLLLPAGADPITIAAGVNPGMASWAPLTLHRAEHGTPQTVAVIGGTGIAGLLAVQNARAAGAEHIIVTGLPDQLGNAAELGADTVPITGDADTDIAAIARAFSGRTPDLVLDFLWGDPAAATLRALEASEPAAFTGYFQIGSLAGSDAAVPAALLRSRPFRITGSGIGSFAMADYIGQIPAYMQLIADKTVSVTARPFPLHEATEAWNARGPRAVLVNE